MMAETVKSSVRLQPTVPARTSQWLEDRARRRIPRGASRDQQARDELGLWRAALEVELDRVMLTLDQAICVAAVLAGSYYQMAIATGGVPQVYAACADAFAIARNRGGTPYSVQYGIDEHQLLDYLATLGPVADHALADAISRHWDQGLGADGKGFATVGLQVTEDTRENGQQPEDRQ
jgi:hypothetical protein